MHSRPIIEALEIIQVIWSDEYAEPILPWGWKSLSKILPYQSGNHPSLYEPGVGYTSAGIPKAIMLSKHASS
jgi:hypothetical protein